MGMGIIISPFGMGGMPLTVDVSSSGETEESMLGKELRWFAKVNARSSECDSFYKRVLKDLSGSW